MSSRFKYCKLPRFDPRKYQWRSVLKENHQQVNQTMDHSKHQEYMRRMVLQQQQEQETNKKNQEQGRNNNTNTNNSVERRTTVGGGGGGAAAKSNAVDNTNSCLVSFLEKDESFLTPWSWDPNNNASSSSNQQGRKNYHQFQRGSFFYREYPEYFGSRHHYQAPHQPDSNKPS
ncbi:hypothetical protein PIB30_061096 [Stylosanthes scabra]|uniref:Uncharacterized protein n=1 Tax=Stylosanthes scabra TaxID=79078 RepID=A0ABU6VKH2_9FABA|nr:hypothetical protein [Stylosanthes scabra]